MPTSEKIWNRKAAQYDAKLPSKGPNYAARLERAAAVTPPDGDVLDVGCATGEITLDLAARCGSVLGIDVSPAMVERANAKASERGVTNATFKATVPADVALEPGRFDTVTVYSVFHFDAAYPAMIRRLHELLKPGGHLVTETPVLGDWAWYWKVVLRAAVAGRLVPRIGMIRLANLEAVVRAAGFEVIDSRVYNPRSGMHCVTARKA